MARAWIFGINSYYLTLRDDGFKRGWYVTVQPSEEVTVQGKMTIFINPRKFNLSQYMIRSTTTFRKHHGVSHSEVIELHILEQYFWCPWQKHQFIGFGRVVRVFFLGYGHQSSPASIHTSFSWMWHLSDWWELKKGSCAKGKTRWIAIPQMVMLPQHASWLSSSFSNLLTKL